MSCIYILYYICPGWNLGSTLSSFLIFISFRLFFTFYCSCFLSHLVNSFIVITDFTPSRGNTPVHHSLSVGNPQTNRHLFAERTSNSTLKPSPTDKKKKLAELFKDPIGGDQDEQQNAAGNQNGAIAKLDLKTTTLEVPSKSGTSTSFVSGANSAGSSEKSPIGDFKLPGEKSVKSAHCCLPRLRSFRERKSPA